MDSFVFLTLKGVHGPGSCTVTWKALTCGELKEIFVKVPTWVSWKLAVEQGVCLLNPDMCNMARRCVLSVSPSPTRAGSALLLRGLLGWTRAAAYVNTKVALHVEHCPEVALICAINHNVKCLFLEDGVQMLKRGLPVPHCTVMADMCDPMMWAVAGMAGVTDWLCSPQCQPWSGAARQRGLHLPDGLSCSLAPSKWATSITMKTLMASIATRSMIVLTGLRKSVGLPSCIRALQSAWRPPL